MDESIRTGEVPDPQLLREVLDAIDGAVALWDPALQLVFWNNVWLALYPEVVPMLKTGMPFGRLLESSEFSGRFEVIPSPHQMGSWDCTLCDGRVIEVKHQIIGDGYCLMRHVDVTQVRRQRVVLARSERMATLGNLVAGVAHDINTPIGNSLLVATTVRDQIRDLEKKVAQGALRRSELESFMATISESEDMIARNLSRASELIQHFKAMAVDQVSAQRRKFRLIEVLDDVTVSLRRPIRLSTHRMEMAVDPALEMDSYPGALGQVVVNLIQNALVHAFPERQGGLLRLVAVSQGTQHVAVSFSDDGIGMSPEILQRVFEPFFTTRRECGGSGLGLSIVHELVHELLGGTLTMHSEIGRGTTLDLLLPTVAPGKISAGR